METPVEPGALSGDEAFLLDAGTALHRFGLPAWRLEAAVAALAASLGVTVAVFSQPTSLLLGFGPVGAQRLVMVRVEPAPVDLGRLEALDAVVAEVVDRRLSTEGGRLALATVLAAGSRWSTSSMIVAHGVSGGAAAVLFGGSTSDVAVSAYASLLAGLIEAGLARWSELGRASVAVSALVVTIVARVSVGVLPAVHPGLCALAGVIVALPGLTFTLGMAELASGHLAAGVSRVASASVTLLLLMVGLAIGQQVVGLPEPVIGMSLNLPPFATLISVVVAALSFSVLLGARGRDLPVILAASLFAYGTAHVGAVLIGPDVGAGLGAFSIGVASNAYGRVMNRTVVTPLVPGVLLLVPGSMGYRSLSALLGGEVLVGVEQGFHMGLVGVAIAAGLVLSQAILPPPRRI